MAMKWKKKLYFTHRWLALVIGLQLLAWSLGGFMFSILDIDNVHGDWERDMRPPPPLDIELVTLTPADALAAAAAEGIAREDVVRVSIGQRFEGIGYDLLNERGVAIATVDAASGVVTQRISQNEAAQAALSDFTPDATVRSVEYLEGDAPSEYRGNPMPVYRVDLEHPKNPHIYLSPVTGEVIKRRNRPWRIFDFFWMLHIMDYRERSDFNHWLLSGASAVAILTSTTGLILWTFRSPCRRTRRAATRSASD